MQKKYYRIALAAVIATTLFSSQALANSGEEKIVTAQETVKNISTDFTESQIILTDSKGVKILPVSEEITLSSALKNSGYRLQDYRTETQGIIIDRTVKEDELIFLFKLEYAGAVTKLPISPQVVRIESDKMTKGEFVVQTQGTEGLGVLTTVTTTDL